MSDHSGRGVDGFAHEAIHTSTDLDRAMIDPAFARSKRLLPRAGVHRGSIMVVGTGGSAMGFSQEGVQEFQTWTVNFDLSTGITYAGAINVVTRSGGNDLHGTAFYFFRDHNLSDYAALNRDPASPDPFFQRRQFGFALAIRRDPCDL